jgi:hypothetical protein
MKKFLFFIVLLCMSSAVSSQVLTQRFAKGEAVIKGVKIKKDMASNIVIEMPRQAGNCCLT